MAEISIQKLGDSCLLVDVNGHRALLDPGFYAWEHERIDLAAMPAPDRLLITHGHQDHLSIEFVQALVAAFPDRVVETNEEVAGGLAEAGIDATTHSTDWTAQFSAPHEPTPMGSQPPHNVGFTVGGVFVHPGDSYTFDASPLVLALPILPPWGSTTEAVNLAKRIRPRHVIPIHDWHLTEDGKKWVYGTAIRGLAEDGITFLPLDDFESVTIDLD